MNTDKLTPARLGLRREAPGEYVHPTGVVVSRAHPADGGAWYVFGPVRGADSIADGPTLASVLPYVHRELERLAAGEEDAS